MSRKQFQIQGTMTALATPFAKGMLDEKALRRLVDFQVKNGVDGLVPCGTTGESPTLGYDEHIRVVEVTVDHAKGRVPVVAGSGSNSTEEALMLTRRVAEAGADAALMITPYYNKPTQEGLYRHFAYVAEKVDIPIILYNVPGRTGVNMLPETVARLAKVARIAGLKDAAGNLKQTTDTIRLLPPGFSVVSGEDALTFPMLTLGGRGVISVVSNVAPREMSDMVRAYLSGDEKKARDLHYRLLPLCDAMFLETNPIPVKAALAMMGIIGEEIRLPLTPITEANKTKLAKAMAEFGLQVKA